MGKIVFPLALRINFWFAIINGLVLSAMGCTIACNGAIDHWHACVETLRFTILCMMYIIYVFYNDHYYFAYCVCSVYAMFNGLMTDL